VISCLLVQIIGIGLYPRLMTDSYRASMEALVARENGAVTRLIHPSATDLIRRPTTAVLLPPGRMTAPQLG
jgi:NAD(P)H-quinone oxidoreductase subunit 4